MKTKKVEKVITTLKDRTSHPDRNESTTLKYEPVCDCY